MLFEYRAACSNPALALRMRTMGVAPRGAMMRCGRQMRWFAGVWWRKRRLVGEGSGALCGGGFGGRGGASAGEGRWLEKGFWCCAD